MKRPDFHINDKVKVIDTNLLCYGKCGTVVGIKVYLEDNHIYDEIDDANRIQQSIANGFDRLIWFVDVKLDDEECLFDPQKLILLK